MTDTSMAEQTAPKLSVITGGKGPDGANWLEDLENGCIFLAKARSNTTPFVQQLEKLGTKDEFTWLGDLQESRTFWAETLAFSRDYDCKKLLRVPSECPVEEEEDKSG